MQGFSYFISDLFLNVKMTCGGAACGDAALAKSLPAAPRLLYYI
jgi:hypothetical protein